MRSSSIFSLPYSLENHFDTFTGWVGGWFKSNNKAKLRATGAWAELGKIYLSYRKGAIRKESCKAERENGIVLLMEEGRAGTKIKESDRPNQPHTVFGYGIQDSSKDQTIIISYYLLIILMIFMFVIQQNRLKFPLMKSEKKSKIIMEEKPRKSPKDPPNSATKETKG